MIKKCHYPRNFYITLVTATLLMLSGCAKEHKKEEMSFDELKKSAFTCAKEERHEQSIDYLEHIITQHADNEKIPQMKLLLAEEYFKNEDYPSAAITYEGFHEFYPSSKHAEYAKYRGLLSKFYMTLRTDCDQTDTEHALKACNEYLDTVSYAKYRTDVERIKETCERKLIDKEIYVFNFYLKQEQLDAAEKRLSYLRKTYLPINKELEPQLMYLECMLAKKQKNTDSLEQRLANLSTKYPESKYAQMASTLSTRTTPFFF